MSKGFFDIMSLWRRWYSAPEEVPAVVSVRLDLIGTSTASFSLTSTPTTRAQLTGTTNASLTLTGV